MKKLYSLVFPLIIVAAGFCLWLAIATSNYLAAGFITVGLTFIVLIIWRD